MIEVRGLVKRYGLKPVLRGLDFSVAAGEFVALVGPNGAGKTTFLRILTSLARPTAGIIQIASVPIPGGESQVRRLIGVVAHQPMLYGDLTAQENLEFFGRMYDLAEVDQRVEETLKLVGLWKVRRELLRAFSRGMQQRLAIARAILHQPELLLLDEPHTGLDQDAALILDDLLAQVASLGRTVVMTSHDLARAHRLADRVDILSRGRVATSISTSTVTTEGLAEAYREATRG
ncbi:MAG: heme ABC exporter ATP-binding protein CcmA [Anaerolineales bacterium]